MQEGRKTIPVLFSAGRRSAEEGREKEEEVRNPALSVGGEEVLVPWIVPDKIGKSYRECEGTNREIVSLARGGGRKGRGFKIRSTRRTAPRRVAFADVEDQIGRGSAPSYFK